MMQDRVKRWIEDIEFLACELPKKHKNLFFQIEEEVFFKEIESLKGKTAYLDDYEIGVGVAKLAALIGDAHTFISLPVSLLCPLELYWFSEGIYVVNTLPEYAEMQYCRITHVNCMPIDEVIKIVSSIISRENDSFLRSQLPKYLPAVEILYGLEIIDKIKSLNITYENNSGRLVEADMKAMPIREAREAINLYKNEGIKEEMLPYYRRRPDENCWFQYLEEHKTVYFKYNSCRELSDYSFDKFAKELMEFIQEGEVEKLVVDMRNNFGGDSTLLEPFVSEIENCKKINKWGSLFVIIGRETFSSALLNAYSFKEKTKAIFIGEPSGGKPNCYGEVNRFRLKNSGLTISYSTKYYKLIEDDNMPSFLPDIHKEVNIGGYVNHVDPCFEHIIYNQ